MTCPSCQSTGPSGAAWCPRCYLPYDRASAGTTVVAGRQRTAAGPPPAVVTKSSWGVRLLCIGLALLVGWGLYFGVERGLSCQQSALHPNRTALSAAVQKQLAVVQTLATGKTGPGWTVADGAKVIAADAALPRAAASLKLSAADQSAFGGYLVAVRSFDTALSTYMTKQDDASHAVYGSMAVALQKAADNLSTAIANVPHRCRVM
jgi:hypothetical protein